MPLALHVLTYQGVPLGKVYVRGNEQYSGFSD
jgi:hypothetical protein